MGLLPFQLLVASDNSGFTDALPQDPLHAFLYVSPIFFPSLIFPSSYY